MKYSEAFKKFPVCCVGGLDGEETISNLVFQVEHELTMYAENQDGCITTREASQCRRYFKWLRESGIDINAILHPSR